MSVSIADPFLLSTYASAKRPVQPEGPSGPSRYTNVYATQEHASTSEAASSYVTVGVQGEGVHIIDASTLHPVISHTLGPSVTFSCPPITNTTQRDGARLCTTYAVIEAPQENSPEECGRTVWRWRESPSGDIGSSGEALGKKHAAVLPHRVSGIAIVQDLPRHVLFVGTRGELTVTDEDCTVKHSYVTSIPQENSYTQRCFVFPRRTASFTPIESAPKQGVLVVGVSHTVNTGHIDIISVDENGVMVSLGNVALPTQKSDIVDITCSEAGWLSVMTRSGEWSAYQLESLDDATIALSPRTTIPLKGLSFISTATSSASSPYFQEISVLSLGSSHVLLAGVTLTDRSSPELALLIWDLQYGVLLASYLFALPSSVVRTKKQGVALNLEGPSMHASQVLLTLTSRAQAPVVSGDASAHLQDKGARRSSILVVPVTVPQTSTIAAAVGRASAGERWVVSTKTTTEGLSQTEVKLVKSIHNALVQKNVQVAEDAFFVWMQREEAAAAQRSAKTDGAQSQDMKLGREFVKRLLEVVLPPPKEKDKGNDGELVLQYSARIVRYLLEKRVVSSSMIHGGLLSALRLRNDWDSVLLAIKTVRDLPEADIISFLHLSVSTSHQSHPDGNAMQVDNTVAIVPPPATVLSLCITYPVSGPALRLAIRQQFRDAEHLTYLLQLLMGWLGKWSTQDVSLLPARTKKDAHGALVPVLEETKPDAPPIAKVLVFLQALLDSSFLTFLTYPPAHALLRDALSQIEPELGFMDDVEQLRGVLQPFVTAQARAVHESAHGASKPDLTVDWRRRRREAHEQAAIAVGVYQIEELVL